MTTPKARTREIDGQRTYVINVDGRDGAYPSVNTLSSLRRKIAIDLWQRKRVALAARALVGNGGHILNDRDFVSETARIVDADRDAIETGNRAHEVADCVLRKIEPLPYPETEQITASVRQFLADFSFQPFTIDGRPTAELTVCHIENGRVLWAGTADAFGELFVMPTIEPFGVAVDWKTGENIYPDSVLTTAGYAAATHYIDGDGVPQPLPFTVDRGLIVHLLPGGEYAAHPITAADVEASVEGLRALSALWDYEQSKPKVRPALLSR